MKNDYRFYLVFLVLAILLVPFASCGSSSEDLEFREYLVDNGLSTYSLEEVQDPNFDSSLNVADNTVTSSSNLSNSDNENTSNSILSTNSLLYLVIIIIVVLLFLFIFKNKNKPSSNYKKHKHSDKKKTYSLFFVILLVFLFSSSVFAIELNLEGTELSQSKLDSIYNMSESVNFYYRPLEDNKNVSTSILYYESVGCDYIDQNLFFEEGDLKVYREDVYLLNISQLVSDIFDNPSKRVDFIDVICSYGAINKNNVEDKLKTMSDLEKLYLISKLPTDEFNKLYDTDFNFKFILNYFLENPIKNSLDLKDRTYYKLSQNDFHDRGRTISGSSTIDELIIKNYITPRKLLLNFDFTFNNVEDYKAGGNDSVIVKKTGVSKFFNSVINIFRKEEIAEDKIIEYKINTHQDNCFLPNSKNPSEIKLYLNFLNTYDFSNYYEAYELNKILNFEKSQNVTNLVEFIDDILSMNYELNDIVSEDNNSNYEFKNKNNISESDVIDSLVKSNYIYWDADINRERFNDLYVVPGSILTIKPDNRTSPVVVLYLGNIIYNKINYLDAILLSDKSLSKVISLSAYLSEQHKIVKKVIFPKTVTQSRRSKYDVVSDEKPGTKMIYRVNDSRDLRNLFFLSNITEIDFVDNLDNGGYRVFSSFDLYPLGKIFTFNYLKEMNLSSQNLTDVSFLNNFKNLEKLNLSDNDISDISFLSNLPKLDDVQLNNNNICDIGSLSSLKELKYIELNNNNISDISNLSSLKKLSRIAMNNNNISDISALSNLLNLDFVKLNNNDISDISALSNSKVLSHVELNNNNIYDISALSNSTELSHIELNNNNISDISALSNSIGLHKIYLSNNKISDIGDVFANFWAIYAIILNNNNISSINNINLNSNFEFIDISSNNISNIDFLSNDEFHKVTIILNDNKITDLSPLSVIRSFTLSCDDGLELPFKYVSDPEDGDWGVLAGKKFYRINN